MCLVKKDISNMVENLRFYSVAGGGFLVSLTTLNTMLKFALLFVSVVYTTYKIARMIREDFKKDKNNE